MFRTPRPPLQWRYAVYFTEPDGFVDGALAEQPADSSPESAQTAACRRIEEIFGMPTPMPVTWTPADQPDWWTGTAS
ncbi:hypothetical protein ACIQWR_24400 [Streptomyces sp. NPDC098789]|uniref:hypothetical protein n=1 Tax=Streptomyces sp. NPDC098789 TaxID=3366098 RepID=UPI003825882E